MSDIFLSYSRKDIAYARLLHKALKEHDLETWIDWQDIPPSTEWLKEIYTAIEEANTFIFIVSSTSTLSETCSLEIDHARKNNKRIIPIVINDVEPSKVHSALAAINWIFSRSKDELQPAIESLIEAIQTDYNWVKAHTRLQIRVLEWERTSQDRSFLLQGTDLQQAENWLVEAPGKEPEPTLLQTRYIQSSRQEAVKRQRRLLLAVGAALIVTIVLGVFAVINGQRAEQQRGIAEHSAFSLATQVVVAEEQRGIAEQNAFNLAIQVVVAEEQRGIAEEQESIAVEQARLAHIRELTTYSQQIGIRFDLAILLGAESFNSIDNYQTRNNLIKLARLNPKVSRIISRGNRLNNSIAFSPDGKTLASGSEDGTIILWDTASGQSIGAPLQGYSHDQVYLSFSPDGKTLATGDQEQEDGTVILWDTATGQPIGGPLQRNIRWLSCIVFSPNGKILAAGVEGGTILWDVASRQPLGDTLRGHDNWVISVAFSPDGKTLASGGMDGIIILWDMDNHQPISDPMSGHADIITSVAFSPDGETLASGHGDGTILMWDVASGLPLGDTLRGHTERVTRIAFSSNGKTMTSVSKDGTIFVWDTDINSLLNRVCDKVGRNFTQEEWAFYFPSEVYRKSCEQWPEGKWGF